MNFKLDVDQNGLGADQDGLEWTRVDKEGLVYPSLPQSVLDSPSPPYSFQSILVCLGQTRVGQGILDLPCPLQSALVRLSPPIVHPSPHLTGNFYPFYDINMVFFILLYNFPGWSSGQNTLLLLGARVQIPVQPLTIFFAFFATVPNNTQKIFENFGSPNLRVAGFFLHRKPSKYQIYHYSS